MGRNPCTKILLTSVLPSQRHKSFFQYINHFPPTLHSFLIKWFRTMSGIRIAVQPLALNAYLDHNNMLRKKTIFRHLRFFSRNQRLLLTFLLLIYLSAVSILSPVLAASLIRGAPLPLQFTATVPETFTTSLQVTVPAGAIASTLIVNCYDCDHTDWGRLSINGRVSIAI